MALKQLAIKPHIKGSLCVLICHTDKNSPKMELSDPVCSLLSLCLIFPPSYFFFQFWRVTSLNSKVGHMLKDIHGWFSLTCNCWISLWMINLRTLRWPNSQNNLKSNPNPCITFRSRLIPWSRDGVLWINPQFGI